MHVTDDWGCNVEAVSYIRKYSEDTMNIRSDVKDDRPVTFWEQWLSM